MSVPSDFVKTGAAVGSCGGTCPKKCGRGSKSIRAVVAYNANIHVDLWFDNNYVFNGSYAGASGPSQNSYFPATTYLETTYAQAPPLSGQSTNQACTLTFNPADGSFSYTGCGGTFVNTTGSFATAEEENIIGPLMGYIETTLFDFWLGYGYTLGHNIFDDLHVDQLLVSIGSSRNQSFNLQLSSPYTYADACALLATRLASISLVIPSLVTLFTGEVVTFDYPNATPLPGSSRVTNGIVVYLDGTIGDDGDSLFDLGGCVAMNGLFGKQNENGISPFIPNEFGTTPWSIGGSGRVNVLYGLTTAIYGANINYERSDSLDHQPFDVPYRGEILSQLNGEQPPGYVAVPPPSPPPAPVVPATITLQPGVWTPLIPPKTGEQIFGMSDAPVGGVLFVNTGLTQPIQGGAGDANQGAGAGGDGSGGL